MRAAAPNATCGSRKPCPGRRSCGRMVMKRPMVAFLTRLLLAIRSRFMRHARLASEKSASTPTAGGSTAQVPEALETVEHRSRAVGMAVSTLPVAPGRDPHRPAGDGAALAPMRFPRILALEVPSRRRPSTDRFRYSSVDPADEPRKPAVGRTADPARIVDAWRRSR
jgi:hypothetical protein